eukprot:Clim_evm23s6 gene=Clim_evmTU23s6
MPTIAVERDDLYDRLGKKYTEEEFDQLCFDFGIELDDVEEGKEEQAGKIIYKIDIPANRYDLLCVEGLARGLNVFLGRTKYPKFTMAKVDNPIEVRIHPDTAKVRPYGLGAVLRGVNFTPGRYKSFIDLQDKLHQNIARKRSLVAIGTHDMSNIQAPFHYKALPPKDIKFIPLNDTREMTAPEMMKEFEEGHLRFYLDIIRDKEVYPLFTDNNGVVLSMPPIINGDHSKINLNTKDIFIDITATDLARAQTVMNIMVTMFAEYASTPFEIEQCKVVQPDGTFFMCPDLSGRHLEVEAAYLNTRIGINESPEKLAELLGRMCLPTEAKGDMLDVWITPTRDDILHPVDVVEDAGIAYGYNNIAVQVPATNNPSAPDPINKLSDLLRGSIAMAGFTEALNFALCSTDENFKDLRKADDGSAIKISNPKTLEFQVARTSLLPGVLKTIVSNKRLALPLKIFEAGDVVLKDSSNDTGARNQRNLCTAVYGTKSNFEVIHGLCDRLMALLEVPYDEKKSGKGYHYRPSSHSTYFEGRQADLVVNGKVVGSLGVLHPEVLEAYNLSHVVSSMEFNVENFL